MTAGDVAAWTGAIGGFLFLLGVFVVIWDWSVRCDPDARNGGPIVTIALLLLIVAGASGCAQLVTDVRNLKQAREIRN